MKKFAVLALALSAMFTLTACGSKEAAAPEVTTEVAVEATETTEATEATEEVTVEEISETEKVAKMADSMGGTTTATVTYENEVPVNIVFDSIQADGSSKHEAAANGQYVMAEGSTPWNEQADAMANFLKENNYDVAAITLADEEGHTDAVTGVSINVSEMVKTAEAALAAK